MKHPVFFMIVVLLVISSQPVMAQSKIKKVVQDMNGVREKRERQAATLHAQVTEQKAQQSAEKKQAVNLPLPAACSSSESQQAAPASPTSNISSDNQLSAAVVPRKVKPKMVKE